MTVHHSSGFDSTVEYVSPGGELHPHFAMMVCSLPHVCLSASTSKTTGYMIIDTACQRSCCGENWMTLQANLLQDFRLQVYEEASQEKFQFGAGNPVISDKKIWVPSAIEYVCMVFGINVLPADIPFLGSLRLMKRLGAVIDIFQ